MNYYFFAEMKRKEKESDRSNVSALPYSLQLIRSDGLNLKGPEKVGLINELN